jgi:hypothetical protein
MAETLHTSTEMHDEIRAMVKKPEFTGQKGEFSGVTDTLAGKAGKSAEEAWDMVTGRIVQFLPDYITEGLIHCSLEKVGEQETCRDAVRKKQTKLKISPGTGFPDIPFKTFYPYLDFVLKAGPVDLLHLKTRFKVEGTMALKDATIQFSGTRIEKISGTINVSLKISLCKGKLPVTLHKVDRPITVA